MEVPEKLLQKSLAPGTVHQIDSDLSKNKFGLVSQGILKGEVSLYC
jgi:hypothetical protein